MEYLRSSQPAVDHRGFFKIVQQAFALYLESLQVAENDRPVLVEDFPKERLSQFDNSNDWVVILFRVHHSEIAGTSPSGTDRKPKGIWGHDRTPHPTKSGYVLDRSWWWENAVVEFVIVARSNRTANIWCDRFHRFMMDYAFRMQFFRSRGVEDFRFVERLEDQKTQNYGQELESRRLRYRVRLEFRQETEIKALEGLNLTVDGISQ